MLTILGWIGLGLLVPAGAGLGWLIATLQGRAMDKARAEANERVRKIWNF